MSKQPAYIVGILGLGQMGGSLAMALKSGRPPWPVIGYDIKRSLLKWASRCKIIYFTAKSEADLIERSQIVVLALPIDSIIEVLNHHRQILSTKSLVVDLGSVRRPIQKVSAGIKMKNHMGIHPICGTALRGRSAWDGKLFEEASCFIFSRKALNTKAKMLARRLVRYIGGRPVYIDCRRHDSALAITSGLPHILAYSLMQVRTGSQYIPTGLEGPSFTGATRVTASDPDMAGQMLYHNRDNLLKAISKLEKNIKRIRSLLLRDDLETLILTLESYGKTN